MSLVVSRKVENDCQSKSPKKNEYIRHLGNIVKTEEVTMPKLAENIEDILRRSNIGNRYDEDVRNAILKRNSTDEKTVVEKHTEFDNYFSDESPLVVNRNEPSSSEDETNEKKEIVGEIEDSGISGGFLEHEILEQIPTDDSEFVTYSTVGGREYHEKPTFLMSGGSDYTKIILNMEEAGDEMTIGGANMYFYT